MRDGTGFGADGGEAGRTAGELDPTTAARVDQVAPTGRREPRRRHQVAQGRLPRALAAFALHALSFVGWFIDDAFITMRYGHNLASGHGMVFNLGERVEGYTDFTWVLLAALSLRLGVDPTLSFPIAGVVCVLGTVASVFATGGRLSRLDAPGAAWGGTIAAGLVATATGAAVYAVTGLETMLFTLLTTLGMTALLERRTARFAVCIGLAFLTRPEAALLGVFGAVWLCARALLRRAPWRELATGVAILGAIVVPYLGWKLSYFGSIVPNTLYAKAPDRSAGWQYLWPPLAATAGLAAASLASLRSRDRRSQVGFFLALWMLWVLAVWWEGGDWMPSIRLLVPGIPFVALAADGEILDWLLAARRRPTRAALGAAAVLVLAPWIVWNLRDHQTARTHFVVTETGVVPLMRLTHALVRARVTSAALVDIGEVGYRTGWRIVDLTGLVDPVIGRSPGRHGDKHFPIAHFAAARPDVVVIRSESPPKLVPGRPTAVAIPALWSVETWLSSSEWFQTNYRYVCSVPVTGHYTLVLMERADRARAARPLGGPGCHPLIIPPRR
ncbi:MAG: hypothetical protein IPN17_05600 [Deltaproteobacteria bacterium]|nr:hypothetical protein [Deltaproteobacteria bacterium]